MLRYIRFSNLFLSSLAGAVFIGTRAAISPSARDFPPATYVLYQQATIRNLIPVMGVLLPGASLSSLILLLLEWRRKSLAVYFTGAGLLAQVAVGTVTQAVNMPINRQVLSWSPGAPPEDWEQLRDRWEAAHTVRTALAVTGLAALYAAAVSATNHAEQG